MLRGGSGERDGPMMRATEQQRGGRRAECGTRHHGMIVRAGGRGGGSVESGSTRPWPIGYAGGMRMGNLPRTGDQPSSARAAARSAVRTPLHAMRYDFTIGVWFRRYGLPSDTSTVGFTESVSAMRRASESGRAMLPLAAIGRTFMAKITVGARPITKRAES